MNRDRIVDEIPAGRGFAVRIARTTWRGKSRVDVRQVFEVRPGYPDTRQPTKKGVSLLLEDLPRLLAALRQIEAEAIEAGELLPEDYENAGLEPPATLTSVHTPT
jgi:hypothetical protein